MRLQRQVTLSLSWLRLPRQLPYSVRQITADAANSAATLVSSSQQAFPLLPSTDEILTFVPNAYFTGVTASGTATVYITPGDGL